MGTPRSAAKAAPPTVVAAVPSPPRDGTFEERVAAMAQRLRMNAGDLMAVMRFESGLRPNAVNPTSHAVGLIQLLPQHAADLLGLPMTPDRNARAVAAFSGMTADQQLDYVEAYFEKVLGGRGAGNLRDAYVAVFYPAAVGHGDGYVIASEGGESAFGRAIYRQNAGLDVNGDGVITAGEAASRVGGVRG
ncbi:MAG: transglycosylase SLT domain-containing protein [Polyangiaceae bacterium]